MDLPKAYNPKDHEDAMYALWEKSGFFAPEAHPPRADTPNQGKPFVIMLPPPNVTGSLHVGHALNAAIQDILIRFKRMQGYDALWVPGTDHAGIATQNVVEKMLKKQGVSRHDLGREKFIEKVWEWKEQYGNTIINQLKKLGASCDWSRLRFTMDAEYAKAVDGAFRHYYEKGWIYKGKRVVSWCTRCQTSLSDLELEYKEEESKLWHVRYPIPERERSIAGREYVVVATTRPETMLGDEAVAVHPKDDRYRDLVGKTATLPIQNREIPIVADEAVDAAFGTGAVKVTPAHDIADFEISQRHHLPLRAVIDEKGRMTKEAGSLFEGLKAQEARERVVDTLETQGLLEKVEPYQHRIAVCYRCDTVIEPLPSEQWFLKMETLAKQALRSVKEKRVKFHPQRWEKLYTDWLENIKDWCISRQIWWGHKIPIDGEEDVLDTWFSSALWPFATLGWPSTAKTSEGEPSDLERYYPTRVLSTARDIINLWVARMVYSGIEFMGREPFCDVIVHATVLAKDGRRMSKSLGTGVDPMDLIATYGADATRFGLIWMSLGGQDMKFGEEPIIAGKKFLNKIWNASRFVVGKLGDDVSPAFPESPKILENSAMIESVHDTTSTVTKSLDAYDFGQALHTAYDFFWHAFCDSYIEWAKSRDDEETKQTLGAVLVASLKLLHPFVPHATETIWQRIRGNDWPEQLMIADWPDIHN